MRRGRRASLTVCVKREISLLTDPTKAGSKRRDGDEKNSCLIKTTLFPVAKHKVTAMASQSHLKETTAVFGNKMKCLSVVSVHFLLFDGK